MRLSQDRDQQQVLVNLGAGNFLPTLVTVCFSRRTLLHGVSKVVSTLPQNYMLSQLRKP
jgi:hypothetical protein